MAWSLKLVLFCSHHAIWHTRNSTKFVRNWRICGDPLLRFLSFLPTHTSPGSSRSPRIYPWPLHAHVPLLSCIRNDVQTHTHTVLSDLSVYIVIVCTIYAAYIIVYIYHFISSIYNLSYHIYSYLSLTLSLMTNYTRKLFYISYCYYTEINVGIRWFYEHAGYVGVQTQNAYNI